MSLILNIETSTKVCSVTLSKEDKILKVLEVLETNYSHSENLNLLIKQVFEESSLELKDLNAIAISEGPGSYTGLRIGTSTAKGLCYALDVSLIVVPTLQILAHQFENTNYDMTIPMLDARRMEVFSATFSKNLELIQETTAIEINEDSFSNFEDQSIQFVGDGAFKMKEFLRKDWKVIENSHISSKGMVTISYQKFLNQDFADTAYFEPFYLKDFVAGKPKKKFF